MRLYLIRHGESETNLQKRWTGWMDVHLTDTGRKDAEKAGAILKDIAFDRIYSSDLTRAVQTARIAIPGCMPRMTPLLREINVGSIAGKPSDVITNEQRQHCGKFGYTEFGGESKEDFRKRINDFLTEIKALNDENIAAFSHAGFLRTMLDMVLGTVLPGNRVCCRNCTVAVFEYSGGIWKLHSWINLS